MLKIQEIRELIKLIDQASIDEFSYEHEGSKIKMKKHHNQTTVVSQSQPVEQPAQAVQPVSQPPVQAQPTPAAKVEETVSPVKVEDPSLQKIVSPMVGTFYAAPNPESGPFVKVGDKVGKDSVVCIVEAMKLFNEIEAEVSGEIVEILVENGQLVEYGQPMFLVKS
ncbi:acetyl-CoA carboxylase biotin carboxyl carrier protein [Bacillus mesophilus]|uniref:Biotin carboxyl carrier protein of acetyl-CoA carboxylase n=1 Tax=Bacillus mesophilus TaxID=1808955 RepID=A0A6M0Q7U3_9BACI|nr:acetyl-CoA carboxylase biotin carboxyl carrier protein [Bacillus mesophilus]MBM7660894.1 acetyl-CoA carboxylase biotin carboxyl carrier protein [Bacillus mesophilus]NEY71560.1 acetyl-CoA carboxylase biotin carboxyl carrier protein [Bacillus mesophilus]